VDDGPRRVVVTRMGIVCPLGNDADTAWSRLVAGESGIAAITRFDASRVDSRIAGEVKDCDPEAVRARRAARRMAADSHFAVAEARLAPDDVDYVNAHGTATPAGEVAETRALKIAVAARAITAGVVPPTINLTDPDLGCGLDYVSGATRRLPVRTAMSNSFGFGGHDISLTFRRFSDGVTA